MASKADSGLLDAVNADVAEFGVNDEGLLFRGRIRGGCIPTHGGASCGTVLARKRTPEARFHELRHHYASELRGHGVSIVAVAAPIGYDPATVLATYAHLTASNDGMIRDVIGGLWEADERIAAES